MPDLSEDLNDEERIWEEIQEIKRMPVRMAQKKELKAQLQVSSNGGFTLHSSINPNSPSRTRRNCGCRAWTSSSGNAGNSSSRCATGLPSW